MSERKVMFHVEGTREDAEEWLKKALPVLDTADIGPCSGHLECPNCESRDFGTVYCEGCEQVLCLACYAEHNGETVKEHDSKEQWLCPTCHTPESLWTEDGAGRIEAFNAACRVQEVIRYVLALNPQTLTHGQVVELEQAHKDIRDVIDALRS